MAVTYDKYYKTRNLFGEPYPELIAFFTGLPHRGKVLDLGCGQGRDAIALARLGFFVTGIDNSTVGIEQMNEIAQAENLNLIGQVEDIYAFNKFGNFDVVLLDSMFHFAKKDKVREVGLLKRIIEEIKKGSLLVVCIQDTGNKVQILNQALASSHHHNRIAELSFIYAIGEENDQHKSVTDYRMIVIEK